MEDENHKGNGVSVHAWLRERLLTQAGLVSPRPAKYRIEDLERTEWSDKFESYMRNRLVMGALRYGPIGQPGKPRYNRIVSMLKRLKKYQNTGNMELLVDVANLCLLEFVECNHPFRHFHSIDGENREGVTITRK